MVFLLFSDADVPSDATLIGDAELSSRKSNVPTRRGVSFALFVSRPNSNGGCFFASGWSSRRLVPFVSENAQSSSLFSALDASRDGVSGVVVVVFARCLVFLKSVRTPPPLTPLNRLVELLDAFGDDVAYPGEKNTTFALLRCSSSSSSSVLLPISKDICLSLSSSTTEKLLLLLLLLLSNAARLPPSSPLPTTYSASLVLGVCRPAKKYSLSLLLCKIHLFVFFFFVFVRRPKSSPSTSP
jgi:hypothetical protein